MREEARPRSHSGRWARRALGLVLLVATVTLVSCQALVASLAPGLWN